MGYKKGPVGHMKSSTGNKAVSYMAEGSAAYMSALHQTDPKDGVVVTGADKSKSASEARNERSAKRKEELARKKEAAKINLANKREEANFEAEERKATAAAKRQRIEQKLKKKRGQISANAEDTSTNYMRGPLNQMDPKDGGKTKKMKDLPLNTRARYEEYKDRNWKQDETSLGKVDGDNITDLTKWQITGKSKDIQRRMPRK